MCVSVRRFLKARLRIPPPPLHRIFVESGSGLGERRNCPHNSELINTDFMTSPDVRFGNCPLLLLRFESVFYERMLLCLIGIQYIFPCLRAITTFTEVVRQPIRIQRGSIRNELKFQTNPRYSNELFLSPRTLANIYDHTSVSINFSHSLSNVMKFNCMFRRITNAIFFSRATHAEAFVDSDGLPRLRHVRGVGHLSPFF